jgi:hypothetical protein
LKAWAAWPLDLSLAEHKLRTKEYDRRYSTKRRRAAGKMPRSYTADAPSPTPQTSTESDDVPPWVTEDSDLRLLGPAACVP